MEGPPSDLDGGLFLYAIKYDEYITAMQTTFYPLIATLFKIMGFRCSFSRPGDNGARWDAIIDDERKSIPIEIKSPTVDSLTTIRKYTYTIDLKNKRK